MHHVQSPNINHTCKKASIFIYFLLAMILVMACLMITPAFSVSFFVNPLVMHTLSAGTGAHPASRGLTPRPSGKALSRVMRTPFVRHYRYR
jgi:hypothetical protein